MPVKVKCSGCEAVLNVPDRARGKAVKCPKCGKGIRVPAAAAAKRKPASVAASEDDDFFSGLDLGRVEDRTARVCPRCGAVVGAEDVDCPACGADLVTGGMGTVQRARAGRKGAAPEEYYSKALKDGGRYVAKKMSLVWKSVLIFSTFGVLALLGWLMLIWCHNWPPQMFWTFVASVLTLLIPGWVWLVQSQVIKRILEPKREKYPVRFEPFVAVSLGIKAVAWSLIFGLPVWLLLGVPGLVMTDSGSGGGPVLLGVAGGLFVLLALASWPVVQAHFAMPITWPGWAIHKVLPDVGRNIGPSLYWAMLAVVTSLPLAGTAAGCGFFAWKDLSALVETLSYNSDVAEDKQAVADAEERKTEPPAEAVEGAKRELKEIDWGLLLWPTAAILPTALLAGFWTVYNTRTAALFVKLFRPNIDELIAHEKEYVYVAKSAEERNLADAQRKEMATVYVSAFLAAALGAAGGMVYATFAENVGYLNGLGWGLMISGTLAFLIEASRLIAAVKQPNERKLRIIAAVLTLFIVGLGAGLWYVGSQPDEPPAAQAPPAG